MTLKENTQYQTRGGEIITLSSRPNYSGNFPWKGSNSHTYNKDGLFYPGTTTESDIVEEIKQKQNMQLEIGKSYKAKNESIIHIFQRQKGYFRGRTEGNIIWAYEDNGEFVGNAQSPWTLVSEIAAPRSSSSPSEVLPQTFAIEVHNERISKIVQERFFEQGICWAGGSREHQPLSTENNSIAFNSLCTNGLQQGTRKFWEENKVPFITLDELLLHDLPKPAKTFKLNEKYTATIHDGHIEVNGVGRIEASAIKEIISSKLSMDFPERFFVRTPTRKLFEAVKEKIGEIVGIDHTQKEYYSTAVGYNHLDSILNHSSLESWIHCGYPEMKLDELFAAPNPKRVKLTDTYTAEIKGESCLVGCQTIPMSKVRELAALL